MKLLFIRHAQSVGNIERRMQGHGEFELSANGKIQAGKLAQRLLEESWWPSAVYSSPLKRAVQTTEILVNHFVTAPLPAAVSDLIDSEDTSQVSVATGSQKPCTFQVSYADELAEFQNGVFQGLTWMEAKARYPEFCRTLETSPDWIQIPEAESLQEARDRAHQFIQKLLAQHQDSDQIWIVTHSWILQHLIAELMGCDRSWRLHARNTALFEFWLDRSRWHLQDQNRFNTDLWQVRRFNDCRHLAS
ncbi:histidine phosphatase family protein [Trichocoleus sp. FACHB-262]|uniref:histidine phosphatase family protein n=1 Tax=Trichocoleus sp. FACHB-262 TaxID=2692869 RepID=UPI001683FDB8|nr:histidine phosphatase family protein [Trichocoleus sp. FACHB-262]MBD2121439.1 histidine phosphatase family protein [Trichocoleus sp. FACHB-262]